MRNHTHNVKIFFLYLVLVFSPVLTNAQTYTWKNAPIGGGGFVTGIITHQTSGDKYCRTDVGGAYRWDAANNKWIQLLDWLNESESGFIGVEALALDPQNANNVYMLCGTEYMNNGRTAILKSTDKGNTFTYTDVTSKFKTHGNGTGRGNGERLAVDPKNSNILFCGSRANGLWKSTDAGVTWNQAWNGVTTTANGNGICFVQFDPSSSVVNGASQTIYIGVSRIGGGNIYKSTDGGATFTDISPNTAFMPHRVALQGTTMYATLSVEAGPWISGDYSGTTPANDMGRVYKLDTSTGIWTNVTPAHHPTAKYPYGGVSIDPTNVNRVIITTCGMYWNNQFGTSWGDFIFLSTDGGLTWTLKISPTSTYDNNGIGWSGGAINWMDCIEFDLVNPSKVRVIGGGGVYTCSDITATNTSWKYDVMGIEETAFLDGVSIPAGPFISSFGDVCGFVHDPLTSFPSAKLSPTDGNNQSIAYAAGNPNKVVRASSGGSVVYYSADKGSTWTASATKMGSDGRVTISADGGTILHRPGGSTTTYYTTNNGGSWSSCSGVSTSYAVPVADQVNSNYFYIYNPENGQMLSSSNKGVSFSVVGTPGTNTFWPWEKTTLIRSVPGLEGHIWVPLGGNGLKYSTNHGATYTTLSNVPYCTAVGIGKTIVGASYPTIFIWGTVSGVTGLFRSTDQGATWLRMNDDAHEFGGASMLIGDMNVDGRVYMGAAGGRGLIYWDASTVGTNYTLTTSINGSGTISMNPSGGVYAAGTIVTVTANPASGWQFSGWSGNLSGSTNPTTLTMNSNKSITATFTSIGVSSTMHVQNIITYTQSVNQSNKRGVAEVTILDNLGNPVSAATVTGTFSGSFNETRTAQTNSNGVAVLTTSASAKGKLTVNICVNNVTHGSLTYNSTGNVITCTGGAVARLASGKLSEDVPSNNQINFAIYPNPVEEGSFKIDLPTGMAHANIMIFDLIGKLVYQQNSEGQQSVEVSTPLKAGIYVVKVISGSVDLSGKLVVK